jgi:hypothetical protein
MIEITNRLQGPVQLVIRSRTKSRAFTCLNIPGRGSGKNVYLLEDERATEYIERAEKAGFISTKYVNNTVIKEGE